MLLQSKSENDQDKEGKQKKIEEKIMSGTALKERLKSEFEAFSKTFEAATLKEKAASAKMTSEIVSINATVKKLESLVTSARTSIDSATEDINLELGCFKLKLSTIN